MGEPSANREAEQLVDQEAEEKIPHLPTPEERMRKQAQMVAADIVLINISGGGLDYRLWLQIQVTDSRRRRRMRKYLLLIPMGKLFSVINPFN